MTGSPAAGWRISRCIAPWPRLPPPPKERDARHRAILEILDARAVSRQSELVDLLNQQGITATQSSISRDLRSLGIAKLGEAYGAPDKGPETGDEQRLIGGYLRKLDTAGPHLLVVETAVGAAQRVAVFLDRTGWPEIVGTVSGDDTIFVATRGAGDQRRLRARLESIRGR